MRQSFLSHLAPGDKIKSQDQQLPVHGRGKNSYEPRLPGHSPIFFRSYVENSAFGFLEMVLQIWGFRPSRLLWLLSPLYFWHAGPEQTAAPRKLPETSTWCFLVGNLSWFPTVNVMVALIWLKEIGNHPWQYMTPFWTSNTRLYYLWSQHSWHAYQLHKQTGSDDMMTWVQTTWKQ